MFYTLFWGAGGRRAGTRCDWSMISHLPDDVPYSETSLVGLNTSD